MKKKNLLKCILIVFLTSFFMACTTTKCECETSKYKKKKYSETINKNNPEFLIYNS
jgi:hypothetical protein